MVGCNQTREENKEVTLTPVLAIGGFLVLTALDTLGGVLLSVKAQGWSSFSLDKLASQLEQQGLALLVQVGAYLASVTQTSGSFGSTAFTATVYAAAVAGSARLLQDCAVKLMALLSPPLATAYFGK
jgi:hypothetical protein